MGLIGQLLFLNQCGMSLAGHFVSHLNQVNPINQHKLMKVYIQRKGSGYLETVDEFDSRKEAKAMLKEYRLSDPMGYFYLSSRACKAWRDSR